MHDALIYKSLPRRKIQTRYRLLQLRFFKWKHIWCLRAELELLFLKQELQLLHLEIHMDPLIWRSKQLLWKILKTMILYIRQHNYIKMIQYRSIIRGFRKVSVLCIFKMGFRWCKMRLQKFTERKKNLVTIYIFLIGHWNSEDNNCFYLQLAVHCNQE